MSKDYYYIEDDRTKTKTLHVKEKDQSLAPIMTEQKYVEKKDDNAEEDRKQQQRMIELAKEKERKEREEKIRQLKEEISTLEILIRQQEITLQEQKNSLYSNTMKNNELEKKINENKNKLNECKAKLYDLNKTNPIDDKQSKKKSSDPVNKNPSHVKTDVAVGMYGAINLLFYAGAAASLTGGILPVAGALCYFAYRAYTNRKTINSWVNKERANRPNTTNPSESEVELTTFKTTKESPSFNTEHSILEQKRQFEQIGADVLSDMEKEAERKEGEGHDRKVYLQKAIKDKYHERSEDNSPSKEQLEQASLRQLMHAHDLTEKGELDIAKTLLEKSDDTQLPPTVQIKEDNNGLLLQCPDETLRNRISGRWNDNPVNNDSVNNNSVNNNSASNNSVNNSSVNTNNTGHMEYPNAYRVNPDINPSNAPIVHAAPTR